MAAILTAGAVVLTGCGTRMMESAPPAPLAGSAAVAGTPSHLSGAARSGPSVAPTTSPATSPATSSAVASTGTSAEPAVVAPRKTLRLGAKGKPVTWMQRRLTELGYRPGKIDGQYGGTTLAAVWAFQKVNGIKPTSTIARRTWEALEEPKAPRVLVRNGKPTRVEINLTKQIMVLYVRGQAKIISHVSSGSNIPYCETTVWQGRKQRFCGSASTPTGNYRTTWRTSGWHKSYLGELYNPIFFNGGIAVHGALSVPLYPASHGCVRLPMNVAEVLPGMLGKGVPVHVRGKFRRA